MKSALDKYVRAYPVPHPFLETPPYVPLFRRRIIAAFTLPGHLAFIACAAALLWFYSQPTIQNTAVVTTQTPGWDCKILGSITTSDELLLSSRQLVLAVNPNCANDLVLPLFTPGDKGVPTLSYDFGGPNYLSSSAFPACPAKDPFGNPMSCLSNTLTGLGVSTIPRYEYPKTRYEYVAIVGPDPSAGFLDYAPMQPSWMTSNQGDFFMHIERSGFTFPTYQTCLSDMYASCQLIANTSLDAPGSLGVSGQAASNLKWLNDQTSYQPTLPVNFSGYHRWQLCSLYPSAAVAASNGMPIGSFYWLDNQFVRAAATPAPQLLNAGAPLSCGSTQCVPSCVSLNWAPVSIPDRLKSSEIPGPADCANALGPSNRYQFPPSFSIESGVYYNHSFANCCTYSCAVSASCTFSTSSTSSYGTSTTTNTYSYTQISFNGPFGSNVGGADTFEYVFEHNQTCSANMVAASINNMTGGPSILKHAFCDSLQSMPPYLCTKMTRRSALEILSLAFSNALSALGAYFAIAAIVAKRFGSAGIPPTEATEAAPDAPDAPAQV